MNRVLIVGAGGHAQVVADILLAVAQRGETCSVVGFLDDNPKYDGHKHLGLPVLGPLSAIKRIPHDSVVVAIGDNRTRARITEELRIVGESLVPAVHPRATLGTDVQIGPGSMVCAGVVVNTATTIGEGAILNTGCTVDHHCDVGPYVHLAPGVHTGGEVIVAEGAFIGVGASVIPHRRIGKWAVVGAGSAVIRDVPDGVTVVGVPARPLRHNP